MSNEPLLPAALLVLLPACQSTTAAALQPAPRAPYTLTLPPDDTGLRAELEPLLIAGVARVEAWFGAPFAHPFAVTVFPHRADFDASFPPEWGLTKSECWMVATGVGDTLTLLSPRVWTSEACEHDPADGAALARLLTHELAHVYHGQRNPSPDFVDVAGIDWFVEGLAVLVSGQLEGGELASAREALATGQDPKSLARAWSGKYRYGVSGSLVACLERELGRARVIELLGATSDEELLGALGWSEAELLEHWRAGLGRGE
jgi:hypothetical protein